MTGWSVILIMPWGQDRGLFRNLVRAGARQWGMRAVSTPETPSTSAWPAAGGPQTLASDADRDTAAGLLNTALAEGRLAADEYDQRLGAAYAARTWQQLRQVTGDLPAPPAAATRQAVPGMFAGTDLCLLCVLLVVCPPAGIAWLFLCWYRSRTDPDQRLAKASGSPLLGGR
jgi:Domain of unknown function (DUF1707)